MLTGRRRLDRTVAGARRRLDAQPRPRPDRLVRADGTLDVVHLVGIPVDDACGDGVISPMPRTNPTMLLDTSHATASAVQLMQEALTQAAGSPSSAATFAANS
jgi:hypothetical protein